MASPIVAQVVENSTPTAGTSHTINHPTIVADQLWLIILDKGSTSATVNSHADWTELLDEASANGLYIAYRWTTGSEGASTTLVTSASTRTASHLYRITGAENPATQAPQIGTTSSGTSATPDPPASATPPSSKDYLFITFFGAAGEEADDDTWSDTSPTNYTPSPPRQKACGVAGTNLGGMIAAAERALTTGTAENPGTFAKDVSVAWRAQTVMIHPAAILATRGLISWAEQETPFVATRGFISWTELEAPLAPTRGLISWTELESPLAPTRGLASWTELEVPSIASPTRGLVSQTEFETSVVATRGLISWVEFQSPDVSSGTVYAYHVCTRIRRRA